jgi:vitamin-K-epoxide reductase (warfarin-sensitive)
MALFLIIILSICGIFVSLYGWYVEKKIKGDSKYKPACDLSDKISCRAVARSSYSQMFFLSNSVLGLLFYITVFVCAWTGNVMIVKYLSAAACIVSLFFAYLLFAKIKSACLICITLYVINISLFLVSYFYKI